MTTQSIAWIFAGTGILIAINQMVLVPKVWLKYFSKRSLAFVMFILFAVGAIAQSIPALTIFIISVVLTTIGQGNLRMVFGSLIANANPEKRGEYLGISQSLMSLSLVIGPLIATATYLSHPGLPFIIAGIIALVSYVSMKALNV
jgi:hypothetical protein